MAKLLYHDSSGAQGFVELGTDSILIGRATDCQIQTQDGLVSRRHARVVYDGSYWVEDNGSANGVYVGAERVQRHKLRPGDSFRCGHLEVRFEEDSTPRPAAPQPVPGPEVTAKVPVGTAPAVRPPPPPPPPPPSSIRTAVVAAPPTAAEPPGVEILEMPPEPTRVANELLALRGELESERRRRTDLESECGAVQKRAADAQRRAEELQQRAEELQQRAEEAQRRAEASERKAEEAERKAEAASSQGSDSELERLQRRVEQLESELRRKGGGGGESLRAAEAERDRLAARVAELEAQRGGQAAGPTSADANPRVAELEAEVRKLSAELDALEKQAAEAQARGSQSEELERAKRRIEQLESEARRRPMGAVHDEKRAESLRTELEAALRQLRDTERERDSLREVVARTGGVPAKPPQQVIDALTLISDGLADMRAALRAAGDELAMEQLEQVRNALRQASTSLGISL